LPMKDLEELIERTKWMQMQVTALRQAIERVRQGIGSPANSPGTSLREAAWPATVSSPGVAGQASKESNCTPEVSSPELACEEEEDRRALPRRRGHPVAVLIARSDLPGSPSHGWVVDRSPEGLCVVAEEAIPLFTWIRVRSTDHPGGSEWFEVEVRNCRPERNIYILGCQFRSALSWSELRQLS
jgi:PilZ domain